MAVDEVAFARQLKAIMPQLVNAAAAYLGTRQDAEDLASEVCLRAWSRRDQWSGQEGSFKAWVWKIFHSRKADRFREQEKRPDVEIDTELVEMIAIDHRTGNPERTLIDRETLLRVLQRLPLPFRDVLVEVKINDHTYQEAADILDLPLGTVMSRLHRLKQLLGDPRKALSDE